MENLALKRLRVGDVAKRCKKSVSLHRWKMIDEERKELFLLPCAPSTLPSRGGLAAARSPRSGPSSSPAIDLSR